MSEPYENRRDEEPRVIAREPPEADGEPLNSERPLPLALSDVEEGTRLSREDPFESLSHADDDGGEAAEAEAEEGETDDGGVAAGADATDESLIPLMLWRLFSGGANTLGGASSAGTDEPGAMAGNNRRRGTSVALHSLIRHLRSRVDVVADACDDEDDDDEWEEALEEDDTGCGLHEVDEEGSGSRSRCPGTAKKATDGTSREGGSTAPPEAKSLEGTLVAHQTMMYTAADPACVRYSGAKRRAEDLMPPRVNTLRALQAQEMNVNGKGHFSRAECCHVSQRYLPVDGPTIVDSMRSRAYIGQFSVDGSMFVAAFQDQRIRVYDVDKGWMVKKDVSARQIRWTITDTALSPDQRFLVYASITPVVHMVNVGGDVQSVANVTDIHESLNFYAGSRNRDHSFGIWSLRFSSDGREIVAGSNDSALYVYDVEAQKPLLRLRAHEDDVNAVAFADESSTVLFSGSDDNFCKVWDRRALSSGKPAGVLVGHLEGITHICSKGDGRHLISNSKDQTVKLWDIRTMMDQAEHKRPVWKGRRSHWDYRMMEYPASRRNRRHPQDRSLLTYRGHRVLQTLIRAYFSPMHTTGQRYIYTGSSEGNVHIYDVVSGSEVGLLKHHRQPVRDCSWHPSQPSLVSVSWDGNLAQWECLRGEKPVVGKHRRPQQWSLGDEDDDERSFF
eukprot:TRINITY_DN14373_c0_g1_i1.p1 TRINITY_DN14373_c0_g1~~TRINITY_DN14373_c0_g1_i1.p1  ORF type:complete len:674 (-),score=99.36 TRINITY_DN14373_c0_g1_i1:561-2582(-)